MFYIDVVENNSQYMSSGQVDFSYGADQNK